MAQMGNDSFVAAVSIGPMEGVELTDLTEFEDAEDVDAPSGGVEGQVPVSDAPSKPPQ